MKAWPIMAGAALLLPLAAMALAQAVPPEVAKRGAEVYEANCAGCHEQPQGRTPTRSGLTITRSPDYVYRVLTTGAMKVQAAALSDQDKRAVAAYLIGRMPGAAAEINLLANRCPSSAKPLTLDGAGWNGWGGRGVENLRFQPSPGVRAADLPKLKLKWVFALLGGASSQPTLVGGRVFVPSMSGAVFSLDQATGCTHWATEVGAAVRTTITIGRLPSGRFAAYLGTGRGEAIALDAETGKELWRRRIEEHSMSRLTGAPALHQGRIYYPVSSFEENVGDDKAYPCCTFRGSVVALDAATGRQIWKSYTIDQAPAPVGDGRRFAPAGAAIWSAPTIDVKRRLLYVATGNAYTAPAPPTSDAIIAMDLATGAKRWVSQIHANDAFLVGCGPRAKTKANCPPTLGPDFDIGSSPTLVSMANGTERLIVSSKSGEVFGLDPAARGKILWSTRIGTGGILGGIEWGSASDGRYVYSTVSDAVMGDNPANKAQPGISALSPVDGKQIWRVAAPVVSCSWNGRCGQAFYAAPTVIPGAVFAGSFDGRIRAFSASDGRMLWEFDTGRSFAAVNGGQATGGSIDQGGQTIAGGTLFVNSGSRNGQPGNALLAFSVDGK